jgi:hypothetical protein
MDGMKNNFQSKGWLICLAGLMLYLLLQGALMNLPLANWSLLPELDDTLTYVLKSRQMQECWSQNCPAINDLRQQLPLPGATPAAAHQLSLAFSRIFPVYHPLFSLILLGMTKVGLGLMSAYQLLWRISPLIFGLAFLYLLVQLTEPAAAGIALALLAFKIYPDTGLHHLVPSNLTMALAVVVWARIISRQGWAPWTLALSSILLPAMHPVGVLYTIVSILLALVLAKPPERKKVGLVVGFMVLVISSIFLISSFDKGLSLVHFTLIPPVPNPLLYMLRGAVQNMLSITIGIVRSAGGIFGAAPVFLTAVVLGFLALPLEKRRANLAIVVIYILFLFGMLFYVSSHPGDVVLRLWIPLVVILFGLVGEAFCYAWRLSRDFLQNLKAKANIFNLVNCLPLILIAVLLGYALQMIATGGEQVYTYVDFLRQRQPLVFNPGQPEMLLSQAKAEDRVFYNSLIIMPYFFIHGTMRLGAVYYHPALQGNAATEKSLRDPHVHYAVTYNPTVYHPSFAGVDETSWWITSPNFRYSPLDKPRRFMPLAREGKIASKDYQWLELEMDQPDFAKVLNILVDNKGQQSNIILTPLSAEGELLPQQQIVGTIPAHWSGWLRLNLDKMPSIQHFRLTFPAGDPDYKISGLSIGDDTHNWPWVQKAKLTAKPREPGAPNITVSFDPQKMLPPPLNERKISILDDSGSSVLFHLQ